MSASVAFQVVRIVLVVALLCAAGAVATPKGRLPLALRGVMKMMRRDGTLPAQGVRPAGGEKVSPAKRLLAFAFVLVAVLLAVWQFR